VVWRRTYPKIGGPEPTTCQFFGKNLVTESRLVSSSKFLSKQSLGQKFLCCFVRESSAKKQKWVKIECSKARANMRVCHWVRQLLVLSVTNFSCGTCLWDIVWSTGEEFTYGFHFLLVKGSRALNPIVLSFLFSFLGGTGVWTQGFMLARQTL
jgi:hypothetical protein